LGSPLSALDGYSNSLVVVLAVLLGVLVPDPSRHLDQLVTPLVVVLVYGSLRGFALKRMLSASYVLFVLLSLTISYVVLPVGGMQVVRMVVSGDALIGFAIVLSVPTTAGSAIIWTRLSNGDDELAVSISMLSLFLAPIATPFVFSALVDPAVSIPLQSLVLELAVIILGGWVLSVVIPDSAVSSAAIDSASTAIILVLIYVGIARVDVGTLQVPHLVSFVSVSVLLLALVSGFSWVLHRLRRIQAEQAVALFFTSGLKNLGIALLIAFSYPNSVVTVPIIVYYIVQQLTGALFADRVE
jgi:predicted Na+-dependent transporter